MRQITRIIIHCAATTPDQDVGVDDIRRWHRQLGWRDVGYHYVIRRDGRLELGRDIALAGAHAVGHNHDSIGICLAGGLNRQGVPDCNYTRHQWQRLESLVRDLIKTTPTITDVLGHRDLNAGKACPCFSVRDWWELANV